jgi:hypothetical protein
MKTTETTKQERAEKMEITKGTRIYYGGDMANQEGFGTVVDVTTSRFGTNVKINMEDGREINIDKIQISEKYSGNGSTRFVREVAYYEWREEQMKRLFAERDRLLAGHRN